MFGLLSGSTGGTALRVAHGNQLTLNLDSGLVQRYPTLRSCVQWCALNHPKGFKDVAADLDLSMSELSRRLNPSQGDPRNFDVNLLVEFIEKTGDLTPLHWLNAKFLTDDHSRKALAVQKLERMLPEIAAALNEVKAGSSPGPARGKR